MIKISLYSCGIILLASSSNGMMQSELTKRESNQNYTTQSLTHIKMIKTLNYYELLQKQNNYYPVLLELNKTIKSIYNRKISSDKNDQAIAEKFSDYFNKINENLKTISGKLLELEKEKNKLLLEIFDITYLLSEEVILSDEDSVDSIDLMNAYMINIKQEVSRISEEIQKAQEELNINKYGLVK